MFVTSFLIAVIPVFLWLLIIGWWDRKEPEPIKTISKLFLSGLIIALVIFMLGTAVEVVAVTLGFPPFGSLSSSDSLLFLVIVSVLIALIHEITKLWFAQKLILPNRNFSQAVDGIVYVSTIALGAVFAENIFSLYRFTAQPSLNIQQFVFNSVFISLMLATSSGLVGLALGKTKMVGVKDDAQVSFLKLLSSPSVYLGLISAIIFHTVFRIFLYIQEERLAGTIVIVAALYLFSQFASQKLTEKFNNTKEILS